MKDLKAFMEDLVKDNNLAEKFKDVSDPEEVSKMAQKEGYNFTAQEYEDLVMAAVNGGLSWNQFKSGASKFFKKAEDLVPKVYKQGKKIVNSVVDLAESLMKK